MISVDEKRCAALLAFTILLAYTVTQKVENSLSVEGNMNVDFDPIYDKPGVSVPSEPSWYDEHEDSAPRIALIMFGNLDHDSPWRPHRVLPPYEESLTKCFGSIQRKVIRPAQESGYAVDIFAHSWNFEEGNLLQKVYQPNASRVEPANGRMMFHSIEAGLELRREFEKRASVTYDWVLVMRHDIFFYSKYDITELNDQLFYVANWCMFGPQMTLDEQIKWGAQHGTDRCVVLEEFYVDDWGVPDFLFVSSPKNIDLVFQGLLKDIQNGVFKKKKTGCCAHAIVGGRIDSLRVAGLIGVGRYGVHNMDFNIFRDVTASQAALSNTDRGVWLSPNSYNWTEEQLHTQCRSSARYCLNGTNNSCPFHKCFCPWEVVNNNC